jgi:hypothetical protein
VATDYVDKIYRTIVSTRKSEAPADVICFKQRCTIKPANVIHECTYSLEHWKNREPAQRRQLAPSDKPNTLNWSGPPAHTQIWRRKTIEGIKFTDKTFGEDVDFVDAACANAKTEIQLPHILYFYNFDASKTATR